MDLMNEFEVAKRTIKPNDADDSRINITIPFVNMNKLCQEHHGEDLLAVLGGSTLAEDIEGFVDKLRIKSSFFKSLFDDTIQQIRNHIIDILKKPEATDVSRLLLVGGFSESPLIQDAIKKEFPHLRVIVPEEAGMVVLKGAVIYGHKPDSISSRIMRYSYGVRITPDFDSTIHREDKKIMMNGLPYCSDIFSPFQKAGS